MTEPDRPDTGGVPALSRRAVLAVPWLAGAVALVGCTEVGDTTGSPSASPSLSQSQVFDPVLENAWVRESILLQRARALRLPQAVPVLDRHVEALLAAGAGQSDYAGPAGQDSLARFVRALDLAADQTQRAVTEPESGSDAALLASIAASDAALAASLRGTRG